MTQKEHTVPSHLSQCVGVSHNAQCYEIWYCSYWLKLSWWCFNRCLIWIMAGVLATLS